MLLLPLIGMRRTFLQGNFSNYGGMLIGKGNPETSIDMAKFVENVLPIVNECKEELTEVAGNLKVLFHRWCRKLTELGLRNTPNCTHLAVYLVSSLELTVNGEPGRPKNGINEETLLHFRALGYKWKDIAELLLISCWTLWRQVGELGISEETGSTIIGNTDLDDSVQAFMNIQGGLVGYSMV